MSIKETLLIILQSHQFKETIKADADVHCLYQIPSDQYRKRPKHYDECLI